MNYQNYEGNIVEEYGVCLEGWPVGNVRNPGLIGGRTYVEKLLGALESGTCYWTRLTQEELAQRISDNHARAEAGEKVYRPRKARQSKKVKSAALADEDDEDDEEDDDEEEEDGEAGED